MRKYIHDSDANGIQEAEHKIVVNACTEIIIIHSGDAEKGEDSWKRASFEQDLKGSKIWT